MPVQKTCAHCATEFHVPSRRSETVKFCSIECKSSAKRVTLSCVTCGSLFERKKHLAETKYCSRACFHSAAKGVPQGARGIYHYRTCEVCTVSFRVTLTRKDTARFCSRACQSKSPSYLKAMGDRQRGEKSPLWKGGLYKRGTGYVRIKGGSLGHKEYRLLHRHIVEAKMLEMEPNHPFLIESGGRKKLDQQIDVHHIDRDRTNNEFSNLLAVTKFAHAQIHHRNRTPKPWECWPHSHALAGSAQSTNPEKDSEMRENA